MQRIKFIQPEIRGPVARLACAILFIVFLSGTKTLADELGELLKRLKLNDLQTVHLERQLLSTVDPGDKVSIQETLSLLYLERLEKATENPEEFDAVFSRLEELSKSVTRLNSPESRFRRFEAEYRHSEFLLRQYQEDRRRTGKMVAASDRFQSLAKRFEELLEESEKRISVLQEVNAGAGSSENIQADREIDRLNSIGFRCSFFAGWCHFYYALTKRDTTLAKVDIQNALLNFCDFLDVDASDVPGEWAELLDFGSTSSNQALLGAGLAYLALGQNEDADQCFELLKRKSSVASVKDQVPFWQIQSLMEFGRTKDAEFLAKAYLDSPQALTAIQKGQISLLLIRFVYGEDKVDPAKLEIGRLGVRTLANLRQFGLASEMIGKYRINLPRPWFYSSFIDGQIQYQKAENSSGDEGYETAKRHFQVAMKLNQGIPPFDLEICRYQLGWSCYRLGEFEQAATHFELVSASLARFDQELASVSAWMQQDCYAKLMDKEPALLDKALEVLERITLVFPDSRFAAKARLQMIKLNQQSLSPEKAVARLEKTLLDSPDDPLILFELCLAHYRLVRESIRKRHDINGATHNFSNAVQRCLEKESQLNATQRLKLALIQLDLVRLVSLPSVDADALLQQAVQISKDVSNTNLLSELHYRQFQLAQKNSQPREVDRHAMWLMENGDGTVFQQAILVNRASQIEKDIKSAGSEGERQSLYPEAILIYSKLREATGKDSETIRGNQNARAAASRLAYFYVQKGQLLHAKPILESLTEAIPAQASYLNRYARVLTELKQYSKAISIWRRLSDGLNKGSNEWYEARFNVFNCLVEIDPAKAKGPLKQFLSIYSNSPEPWKEKLLALARRAGVGN